MSKNNFSRSNVNEQMLQISMPDMSAFPMSHTATLTPKMGEIIPFNVEPLLPRSVINGKNTVNLQLEKILTPSIGRVRCDTHNFVVLMNRINRDWKFFVEGASGHNKVPSFSPTELIYSLWCYLLGGSYYISDSSLLTPDSVVSDIAFLYPGHDDPTDEDFVNITLADTIWCDQTDVLGSGGTPLKLQSWLLGYYWSVMQTYKFLIDNKVQTYGFNLDFYKLEYERMREKFEYYNQTITNIVFPNFAEVVLDVLKPYFGVGSLFDHLGYSVFDQYQKMYENIHMIFEHYPTVQQSPSTPLLYSSNASSIIVDFECTVSELFLIDSLNLSVPDHPAINASIPQIEKSEMPLRAYYSIWYDYFRNFHVEKRSSGIFDPDTFDKNSIIAKYLNLIFDIPLNAADAFNALVTLIIPRKRNFARDYLTTVQVDDIYRYVYTPWLSSADGSVKSTDPSDGTNEFYDNIKTLLLDSADIPFPMANFTGSETLSTQTVLQADLQTMRRSKMLERVLAREYYYPDTYAGRMLAHYGIKPGDIDSMNSVYVAGSEQFISGDQLKANIGTEMTPQGTRTFYGGVSNTDGFSYAATDHAIFMSVVSLVPMVLYDAANMHLDEITLDRIPLPQFASDTRCLIRPRDMLRSFDGQVSPLGYVPRYYQYRVHPDEAHGKYLTDYRAYNFLRDWYTMTAPMDADNTSNPVAKINRTELSLNPYFLRVNVPLDAFLGLTQSDPIAFGDITIECSVVDPLPAAIEFI